MSAVLHRESDVCRTSSWIRCLPYFFVNQRVDRAAVTNWLHNLLRIGHCTSMPFILLSYSECRSFRKWVRGLETFLTNSCLSLVCPSKFWDVSFWCYSPLTLVSEFFTIIFLRSPYHAFCMTNTADKMPSNIQVMNQPPPLYRTLTDVGLRRENVKRILHSSNYLLNVVAQRFKACWRWIHYGQFVITHH